MQFRTPKFTKYAEFIFTIRSFQIKFVELVLAMQTFQKSFVKIILDHQWGKSVHIRSFSGPHFPAFGLNTVRYGISLWIQFKHVKIRPRKIPNTESFHAAYYETDKKLQNLFLSLASILTIKIKYWNTPVFWLALIRQIFYLSYCSFRGVNHSWKYSCEILFWFLEVFWIFR